MRGILSIMVVLVVIAGCERKSEDMAAHDAKVAQEAREALLKELAAQERLRQKQEKKEKHMQKLARVGIEIDPNGKIIIDTNKTKHFLHEIGSFFHHERHQKKDGGMNRSSAQMPIDTEEMGIIVKEDNITIDLNKTEHFLERWSRSMEEFAKEFDTIADEIDRQLKGE